MDHGQIAEQELVERYYRRELPPDLEARFEEHFLGCGACQEQLAVERGLASGTRALALEEAARTLTTTGILAWLARRRLLPTLALLAILIVTVPLLWHLHQSKERAEDEAVAWRQQARQAQQAQLQAEQQVEQQAEHHAEQLAAAVRQREAPPPQPANGGGEPLTPELFLLRTVRGTEAIPQITAGPPVTLAAYLDPDPRFTGYRVTLTNEGETRWRRGGLQPNALESLLVTFPADFLNPGTYRFYIAGELADGGVVAVEDFGFAVVPRNGTP
jgi:hypothetical protein